LQPLGTVVEDAPVAPKGFEEVDDDVTDDSDDDDSDTDSDSDDDDDDDDGGNTHAFRYGALSFGVAGQQCSSLFGMRPAFSGALATTLPTNWY
jgi:hypothetical protein